MTHSPNLPRRRFLQASLLGSAAFAGGSLPAPAWGAVTKAKSDPYDGLKVGVASYSLRKFKPEQAFAMTKQLGVKYITLKDMHLPLKSTPDQLQATRKKIEDAGLTLMGAGVISMKNNEAEIRSIFEYAKNAGLPTIVCMPDRNALDAVEKCVKEYDIRIAIHNHGPTDKNFPSPLDALKAIEDRDSRMGICIDVGHTVRIAVDPIECIHKCASRLYDFHIKDVTAATAKGTTTAMGRGTIDLVAVAKALLEIKFPYHVALEYEANADDPLPGMIESFAYLRGILAAIG
ncbi:MAG: sugar phosphate isomerase/epimerase [Pirellulales bacterium]|nr:sugar phosphate isomerase/epimerase [Pirellulales bacterium]